MTTVAALISVGKGLQQRSDSSVTVSRERQGYWFRAFSSERERRVLGLITEASHCCCFNIPSLWDFFERKKRRTVAENSFVSLFTTICLCPSLSILFVGKLKRERDIMKIRNKNRLAYDLCAQAVEKLLPRMWTHPNVTANKGRHVASPGYRSGPYICPYEALRSANWPTPWNSVLIPLS
jgi:hypothetical protein